MSESSEEKDLPASEKKLRDARKKGQLAQSQDMVTAVSTVAVFIYLLLSADGIARDCMELLRLPTRLNGTIARFEEVAADMLLAASWIAARIILPPVGIGLAVGALASVLVNQGPVFSLEPMTPKLENLDPIKGFKRIYGARSATELAKSLVKMLLLGTALSVLVLAGLDTLIRIPGCGLGCVPAVFGGLSTPLIAAAALIFLAIGLVDVLLQRWLFQRDMRMTKTEAKREQIDQNGNPIIRGALQRQRREALEGGGVGVRHATVLVAGDGAAVGLRFVRGETPVPMVVCRGAGDAAKSMLGDARALGVVVMTEPELAVALAAKLRPGSAVPSDFFADVARVILRSGTLA